MPLTRLNSLLIYVFSRLSPVMVLIYADVNKHLAIKSCSLAYVSIRGRKKDYLCIYEDLHGNH